MRKSHLEKISNGFTLVELQIAIIVSAILMLGVVGISQISNISYNKLLKESEIYADLGYGLKMVRNKVRESSLVKINYAPGDPGWVSEVLVVDKSGFGLYKPTDQAAIEFVYVENLNDLSDREVLFKTHSKEDQNQIKFDLNNGVIKIKSIKGNKEGITFELPDVSITRRVS